LTGNSGQSLYKFMMVELADAIVIIPC
jgi:hypothetical protein